MTKSNFFTKSITWNPYVAVVCFVYSPMSFSAFIHNFIVLSVTLLFSFFSSFDSSQTAGAVLVAGGLVALAGAFFLNLNPDPDKNKKKPIPDSDAVDDKAQKIDTNADKISTEDDSSTGELTFLGVVFLVAGLFLLSGYSWAPSGPVTPTNDLAELPVKVETTRLFTPINVAAELPAKVDVKLPVKVTTQFFIPTNNKAPLPVTTEHLITTLLPSLDEVSWDALRETALNLRPETMSRVQVTLQDLTPNQHAVLVNEIEEMIDETLGSTPSTPQNNAELCAASITPEEAFKNLIDFNTNVRVMRMANSNSLLKSSINCIACAAYDIQEVPQKDVMSYIRAHLPLMRESVDNMLYTLGLYEHFIYGGFKKQPELSLGYPFLNLYVESHPGDFSRAIQAFIANKDTAPSYKTDILPQNDFGGLLEIFSKIELQGVGSSDQRSAVHDFLKNLQKDAKVFRTYSHTAKVFDAIFRDYLIAWAYGDIEAFLKAHPVSSTKFKE